MSIDPRYMIASSLQEYFVDKDTGLPLSGGIVSFYSDVNRTQPKPVYMLSGSPPSYIYTELPNPLILSAVGTPQYNGNDIVIYYYPYDDNGNVELYYVTVTASDTTPQFTREAWPNFSLSSNPSSGEELINYIPNPLFLAHNNLPADPLANPPILFGQVTQPTTQIAPGGWIFERPSGSNAIDFVTFFRYGSFVDEPTQSPRYAVQINTTSPDITNPFKRLGVVFDNVNKFTDNPSPSVTNQVYTLYFEAQTVASANFNVLVQVIKNFGSGGSSPITLNFNTFTITNTVTAFTAVLDFGDNTGQTIGDNDDDYVEVALSFPTNLSFNGIFTNFVLTINNTVITEFPTTTDADMMARTMTLPPPDPNGMDIYLPIRVTPNGLGYDDSQIGKVFFSASNILAIGELPCDGTMLETAGYSSDGIPYVRLFNKIVSADNSALTWFGPAKQYVAMYVEQVLSDNRILMTTNQPGGQTVTTDGVNPTGFTFTTPTTGQSSLGFSSYYSTSATDGSQTALWCVNNSVGAVSGNSDAGNSGLFVVIYRSGQDQAGYGTEGYLGGIKQLVRIALSTVPAASTYFNMATPSQQYYFWFLIDGVGTDPAQPGIGVPIHLLSTMGLITVTRCIVSALNAWQTTTIQTVSGSSLPNSSYFNFYSNGQHYYVWFSLNGTGVNPSLSNAIGIQVTYLSSDSDVSVGTKMLDAVNTKYYATPPLQGLFIRGVDGGAGVDPDLFLRYSSNAADVIFQGLGTLEFDEILSHYHKALGGSPPSTPPFGNNFDISTPSSGATANTQFTGGDESRPINMALNYVIKY
jgi:hypothetical protein